MACKYWYDGQWRTETQFKKILSEGVGFFASSAI